MQVVSEEVRFEGRGGDELTAFLARPEVASEDGGRAGLILVHEVFGLDEHMRDVARRFAEAGHVVLAPDLYSREGLPGDRPEDGQEWSAERIRAAVASLPDRRVLGDLEAGLGLLASREDVDSRRLAAVGFCMGGNYAYLLGCHSSRLSAAVDFYGRVVYPELGPNKPVQPLEMALNLGCPLLAVFGEDDPSIPMEDVEALRRVLSQFSREFDIVSFPGAGHGFFNDRRPSFVRPAAEAAWQRTLGFLQEHLAP